MEQLSTKEAIALAIANLEMSKKFSEDADEEMHLQNIISTLQMIVDQRGCIDYGNDCPDGQLTTLMDTIIFG